MRTTKPKRNMTRLLQPSAAKSRLFGIVATLATWIIIIIIIKAVPSSAFVEPRGTQPPNGDEESPSAVHPFDAALQTSSDYTQTMRAVRKRSGGRSMSMSLSMTMDPSPPPSPVRVDGCTVRVRWKSSYHWTSFYRNYSLYTSPCVSLSIVITQKPISYLSVVA